MGDVVQFQRQPARENGNDSVTAERAGQSLVDLEQGVCAILGIAPQHEFLLRARGAVLAKLLEDLQKDKCAGLSHPQLARFSPEARIVVEELLQEHGRAVALYTIRRSIALVMAAYPALCTSVLLRNQ